MGTYEYFKKRYGGPVKKQEEKKQEEKKQESTRPVSSETKSTGSSTLDYFYKHGGSNVPAETPSIQFDRNQAVRRRQTNNPFQAAVESYNAGKVDLSKLKYRDGLNMNQTIGNARGTFTPSTPEPANLTREGQWAAKHPLAGLGMYAVTNYIGGGEGLVNSLDAARRAATGQGKIGANEINAAQLAQAYRTGASEGIRRYVANSNENLPRVLRAVGNIDSDDGEYSSGEQALDFLTGVGADAASSSLNMAMGGNLSTYLMGANAANQSLYDTANDEKTTSGQALALAAANGIAEAFFEKFSVENAGAVQEMFRQNPVSVKDFARTLLVSAGVEGSEEMNTEIANILSDIFIRGENSESGRMYARAIENGAEPNAAAAEVLRANLKQIGMAGLGGALSGGLHTGLYSSVGTMQRGMDLHNVTSAADIMDTIDTSTKEGQTAYDIASDIAKKEADGKRATAIDYGRLQNAINNAVEAASVPSTEGTVSTTENAVPTTEEAVPTTDDVEIREAPRGDFRSSDAIRQTAENVRAQMDADYQEAFNEMYGADTEGIKGRGGDVEGSKENKRSYHIPVETLMRIDEDNRQNKAYSGLGRYGQETFDAQSFGRDAYDSATSLYNSIRFGQDLTEAEKMRNARLLTDDQVFNISQAAFKDLNSFYNWDRAGKISAMAEKHTLKDVTPGKVTYADGIDIDAIRADGSKEARQKVAQMAYAEGLLSKVFGYNVHWIQSGIDDNTGRYVGENGSYDPSTHTISLDINAGADYVGDAVKYGTVISHELTHTLELGAVEQYKKIADSVMNILVNDEEYSRGRNAQQIIADMIENNPHVHNEAEAVHELVAQACEDMLNGNRDVQEMLAGLDEAEQKSFFDRISDIFNSILQFIEDMLSSDAVKSDRREAEALRRAKEEIEGLQTLWNEGVKNAAVATKFAEDIESEKAEHSTRDDTQDKINHSMTMEQAKRMIQAAFAANDIKEWYDGKFKNGDEWAREVGSEEVALYIENTYELQEKYINANEDINNDEYMIEDVIDAYLNGTLVGKEKPKPKRIDVSKEVAYEDSRFYAPHNEAVAREVYDLANQRVTKSNQTDVYRARTKILFAAHGGNLAETLGISESELNKKLRTWSRYSSKTRDLAERLNRGVAAQNRWAGLQNCSILSNSNVTDADIESMVKSVEGTSRGYERSYIGKTLLAIDTHMDWSWLGFNFKQGRADESRASVRGYYFKNMVTIGGSSGENTVAHEMGHAMDHKWFCDIFGEDVEKSDDELTRTVRREDLIKDPDARQFYRNFRIFIDSLTDSNDLRSSYTMAKNETFARFVAKFVEWTNKTAGNYFYSEPYGYNDRFTTSQYLEFVRLLQEKAAIDTKKANNGQYSSRDIETAADDPNDTSVIRMGSEKDIKYSTRFAKGINDKLRVHMGTFFAGTGTVDFALRNIVSHQFAVEYDAKIAALYKLNNNGGTVYADDVRNVKVDPYKGRVEYFHASPVCKSYSGANNDSGEKPLDIETARATARAIEELNPKVVTIENVARYRNSNAIKIIEEALTKNGYTFDKGVYKATDFGGATIRERMFIRAVKDGVLPDINEYKEAPKSWYSVVEDLIDKLPEEPLSNYMKDRLEVSGIDIDNLAQPVLVLGGNKGEKLTYAYADKPSPTIIANSTESRIIMPDGRVLRAVPRVLARIQGLPDDFDLGLKDEFDMKKSRGSVTRAYTVVGNGVTTQLTEGVFEPLLKANIIDRKSQETGISYSTRDNTINGYTPSSIGSIEELMRYNSGIRDMSAGLAAALEAKGAKGAKLSDAQIEKIARKFIKEYGSQADPRVIADGLKSMYEYIDATSKVSASQLGKIAHDYAREILNTASETDDTLGQLYPELRDGFKKARLKLTDELKGDIVYNYDSIPNFKRQMRGVLDISEKGTQGVDTYYEELKGMYPDLFPDDIINPSDQLQRIAEVAEMLQKHTVKTDFGEDLDEVAYVLGQEMLAQYFAEKGDSTHKREVAAIKAEMTKKHQAEMAALRADAAKEYGKLKARLGDKALKVANVRAELNAMHRRVMERRELRLLTKEAKKRLMKQAKALWKLKGSAEFESAKRDLIGNLDLVSYGMSDGTRLNLEKIRKDALTQAAQDPDYAMSAEFADAQKLYERLNKQRISDMSLEQIESLTKAVLALKNSQQTYNRMLKEELGDYVADYGSRLITQQQLISGIRGKSHMMNALKRYALYMENPTRAAHLLDGYQQNGVFTELFDDINEGAIRAESFRQRADEMFRPVLEDKELTRTWSKQNIPIKVGSDTYYISKGMRIAIYLHSLNNDNMRHVKKGGFTIPDEKLYRQGRYTEAYAAGKRVPMSEGTVREIIAEMTPAEKKFAGVAKEFFNSVTKDAINEVSLQLKGFELAMVNNYMPIRTNPNFTQREIEGLVRDASIEGAGQFKDRVPGASNPILLEDIAQVIKRQTDTTAQYYGLAIPVRNANKVWNFTSYRFNNSVKDAVAKNWLTDGAKIFENVMTDIQAGARRGDTGSHLFSAAKGAYAAAVLTANVGVSIKQSASYPLAIHMLDAASLAKGIVGKVDREYMDSITPLSWARRHGMGGQVEVADVFRQKGMIDDNPMVQKMKDLTNWIQAVDVATTDHLFVACEEYVKAHNPGLEVRGDEYNKMVADLYNSVLQRTQPSYGVMQRNELMRSSDAIMKALTMFKTQTFNMGGELLDAGLRVQALSEMQKKGWVTKEEVNGAKRNMANVVGATILSQAMLAILATMANALLHKMKPYRDDEGNVTIGSVAAKTARDFGSSFFGLFFGLDVASQMASAVTGGKWYDVTAPQLDGINEAISATSKWSEALSKYMNGSGTKTDLIKQSGNMAIKISGAFGIPANNVYNIANAVNLWVQDVQTDKVGTFESGYGILGITDTSLTAKQYKDRLYRAVDQYGYGTKEYEKAMDELKRKTGKEEKEIFGSPYDDLYQVYREHGENSQEFKNRVKFLEEIGKKPKDIAKALNNRGATVTIK